MHVEVLVGKTTRPAVCVLCSKPIAVGTLAAYTHAEPKGSRHIECHLRGRGRK